MTIYAMGMKIIKHIYSALCHTKFASPLKTNSPDGLSTKSEVF